MLQATDPTSEEPALLWNGALGIRFNRDATGNGQALFDADEYHTTGEEKIVALPSPLVAQVSGNQRPLDPSKGTEYLQSLDMGTGLMTTSWRQTVGGQVLVIEVRTAIHPERREIADRWTFGSLGPVRIDFATTPDAAMTGHSERTDDTGHQVIAKFRWGPSGTKVSANYLLRGGSVGLDGKTIRVSAFCDKHRAVVFTRTFSFGKSPTWLRIQEARGRRMKMAANWDEPETPQPFAELANQTAGIWRDRWKTDIEIDGPVEDQLAIHSWLFYLRSGLSPSSSMSISPMGLSSAAYSGHVFWDADIWVFPALAFVDPKAAAAIPAYRVDTLGAARTNAAAWIASGRPTANGHVGGNVSANTASAMYAWESSVTGRETVPGPSKFEHHITGDVAFSARQASQLGVLDQPSALQILYGAALFFRERSEPGPGGKLQIKGVMSPDENHTGDNDLYTNLLAEWSMAGGAWPKQRKMIWPHDDKGLLTYDGDALRSYKQAAAVLSIYPLQVSGVDSKAMMERFEKLPIKNGPAMTDSIHSIIWSRLGDPDKAYVLWHDSWKPFMRSPLGLFSEKRSKVSTYFTTGAAGSLQAVIYGFLGFRIDPARNSAATSLPLRGGWLNIRPKLPAAWKSATFKNFKVLGMSYTLRVTPQGVKLAKGG
jgi:trehalose/maltose hydrolase-like predicted phosphorylase